MGNSFFVGRKRELKLLEDLYDSNKFEMLVLHGRRRIGKTYLLAHFTSLHEGSVIFFSADKSSERNNVQNFCKQMAEVLDLGDFVKSFQTWQDVYSFFEAYEFEQRIAIIIDEFTYLLVSNPAFDTVLQNAIDRIFKHKNVFLILCGSEVSVIGGLFDDSAKPLYGRKTCELKLEAFSYSEACEFFPKYDNEQKFIAYAVTGGIPLYLSLFDDKLTIRDNVIKNCLSTTGYLFGETDALLRMELKEPSFYKSIMESIGSGVSNLNKIAQKIQEPPAKVAKYLSVLMDLGIVRREVPCGEKSSSRKALYSIADNYFAFYFMFVFRHKDMLNGLVSPETFYDRALTPEKFGIFLGHRFEEVCRQYLIRQFRAGRMPFVAEHLGRWWGGNPKTKKEEEIDILALNDTDALVCECKFTNDAFDEAELKRLQESALCINRPNKHYMIFSKNGVTSGMRGIIDGNPDYMLVTFDDLYASY